MSHYTLYYREGSGSMVIEAALLMAGASYDRVLVPDNAAQRETGFLTLNPAGKIPVLVLPDGTAVAETVAIILVLDETYPAAGLLPSDGANRTKALQRLAMLATSTYSHALSFYYPARSTTATDDASISAVAAAAAGNLDADFVTISAALGTPFFFDAVSIVDVYAMMLADWHAPALKLPKIKALKSAILAVPAIHKAWVAHDYAV